MIPRFDALSINAAPDPYPAYERMRAAGPICRAGPGIYAATDHASVAALLRDERLIQFQFDEALARLPAAAHTGSAAREFSRGTIVALNRPAHTPMRHLLTAALRPELSALPERIAAMTDDILDAALARGQLDAAADLAHPVPFAVLMWLLGIPESKSPSVARDASDLARIFTLAIDGPTVERADEAVHRLRGYFMELMAGDASGVLRRMRDHPRPAGVTDRDIADNAIFLILAGLETSVNLIATGCLALAARPDQATLIRADPAAVPMAVEEFLRFDAPTRVTARLVISDLTIAGVRVPAGRAMLLMIASGNHDPARFREPASLDVTRTPNPHLSFGGGVHHCVGAALARMEAAIVFDRLIRRLGTIEPAGEPRRDQDLGLGAYLSVPLAVAA